MNQLTANPLFGLVLSIGVYLLASKLHKRYPTPLFTPLLLAIVCIIVFLKATGISYEDYFVGGSILNALIGPSTVALAIPLYRSFSLMKRHVRSILISSTIAALVNSLLSVLFIRLFDLENAIAISIFPRSVTTAMAIGISEKLGGSITITLVMVVATGVLTSAFGLQLLKFFRIKDPIAQGVALGGTGHAVGTGKALELGKVQGAMAGLSIGVTGILYVVIVPIVAGIFL